ncbi:hypothetical protein BXT86_06495 [candidate division WOR-3 bacterium 4484_100]|uniref:Peptidase M42 n=1 Tax=candidate division WOR-3 bacterium 4484_100 TaxID=1936077 RepID=A0A1V4QDK8_UNCW3|nr:MAG: hypothetical protein BXT86_06495 [candidate division WOR-3 bacterium 4484_100]
MEYLDGLLEKLTQGIGVGYTGNIRTRIKEELEALDINAEINPDGSVTALLKGSENKSLFLACHLDEIGYIVSSIDEVGRIYFSPVGGSDIRLLPGQEVVISGKVELNGYVGVRPPHLLTPDERNKVQPLDKLFVDIGLPADYVKENVQIGDVITFSNRYYKLNNDLRSAKSLDDRAGVACGILVLKELAKTAHRVNVYFVATNQEEFTSLGARVHSYRLPVDYGLVVDVTFGEYPGLREGEFFALNKGPTIARGATIPEKLYNLLIESAQELEIPYQVEPITGFTGTDADAIAFNREGIPTCIIGIPVRYMHSPVEVVALKDIERSARLITGFIKKL